MGTEEQFCLRWNDFQESVTSTLQELLDEQDFLDVTISCGEGEQQFKAHKVILSACSSVFRQLLKRNPAPNPVIVLWDVATADFENILHFMYNGEVKIKQSNLNSFLSVAERLRVRGLCQAGSSSKPSSPPSFKRAASPSPTPNRTPSPSSSPNEQRRPKQPHLQPEPKKQRPDEVNTGDMPSTSSLHIKEEFRDSGPTLAEDTKNQDDFRTENLDENSIMSRSGGSEADYSDYPYDQLQTSQQGTPSGLQHLIDMSSMGHGLSGQALAAMEHKGPWRRASDGSNASSPYPPPPRMPGTPNELGLRRPRTVYTSTQIHQLETYFRFNEYIDGERKRALSMITKIPEPQIKVWFQNRRQKKKREEEMMHHSQQPQ